MGWKTWLGIGAIFLLLFAFLSAYRTGQFVDYEDHVGDAYATYWGNLTENCCGEAYSSGHMFYAVSQEGDIHGYAVKIFRDGSSYNYTISIKHPEAMGDVFMPAVYLSDSVVYVGNHKGKIYYADPARGNVIWTADISSLPVSNYMYNILWGDAHGHFFVLLNDTIYEMNGSEMINSWDYNFSGYLMSAHYWHGGFFLKFGILNDSQGEEKHSYEVYYVKNGTTEWKLTFSSSSIYFNNGLVYYYSGSNLIIYKDGNEIKKLQVRGDIESLRFIYSYAYVFTYYNQTNEMYVYNHDLELVKRVMLYDLKNLKVWDYPLSYQSADIYENKAGFIVYLYTTDEHNSQYVPLRIIQLDKNLNVVHRNYASVYLARHIYPYHGDNSFILVSSEFDSYYIVHLKNRDFIDVHQAMSILAIGFIILGIIAGYFYVQTKEMEYLKKRFEN